MEPRNATVNAKTIKEILSRLDRIEKVLFAPGNPLSSQNKKNFSGPSGGVRFLISRGFFKSKKLVKDVRNALRDNGYHYGGAQIQTAMNRFSKRNGPLVASKEGGNKTYVDRK